MSETNRGLNSNFSLEGSILHPQSQKLTSETAEQSRQETLEQGRNESADKIKELEEKALKDEMTGVYSKNSWEDFKNRFDQNRGDKSTIIMVDLNGLKGINDSKGHNAGDEYIKNTASYLKTVFSRKGDEVYRIGGDEFAVVCRFIEPEEKDVFESYISSHFKHETIEQKGLDFAFGIAYTDPQQDTTIEDTIDRADYAMYQNKAEIKAANPEKYLR